jgi:hypothetical protein
MNREPIPWPANRRRPHRCVAAAAMWIAGGLLAAASAGAAPAGDAGPTPQQIYERDRAACLSGNTSQDQSSCLREAGAALQERRRGQLGNNVSPETFAANAIRRCEVHKDPDAHQACVRMARGEGTQSGSVAKGGVVKEYVTRIEGEPASAPAN